MEKNEPVFVSHGGTPTTVATMWAAVEEAWRNITNEEIQEIVDTMPARVQAVIAARGGHTRY